MHRQSLHGAGKAVFSLCAKLTFWQAAVALRSELPACARHFLLCGSEITRLLRLAPSCLTFGSGTLLEKPSLIAKRHAVWRLSPMPDSTCVLPPVAALRRPTGFSTAILNGDGRFDSSGAFSFFPTSLA